LIQAEAERRFVIEEENKGVEQREREARRGIAARTTVEQKTRRFRKISSKNGRGWNPT